MTTTNGAGGALADYDKLPYPSMPIVYTQPGSLAAMATLFGAVPGDATKATVLELGCASGGNIIPLALRFPDAHFVGIDLSARHVQDANERIAKLGLKNIAIRQGDIAAARFERETFDFIICHGVFSWVPRAAQDGIFRICNESLRPSGIAAISYNVLPGWHLRRIVRDILLFHADPKSSPAERVAQARKALSEIAGTVTGNSPYASLLRSEAERLVKAPSAYILGEFLVDQNAPCYFSEFAARSAQAGLTYLCDGEAATSLPDYFAPNVAKHVREMARDNPIALQQYTDFFTGRPFRRSLLVRTAQAPKPVLTIDPARARHLHFAADLRLRAERSKAGEMVYLDQRGRPIRPKGPISTAVVEGLAGAFPSTRTLNELIPKRNAAQEAKALQVLTLLLISEQATVSTVPLRVGRGDGESPRAWSLARLEAAACQPWVTALHHMAVRLAAPVEQLLPHLNGNNNRAALLRIVGDALSKSEQPSAKAEDVLAQALAFAARHGLLEP